MSSPIRGQPYVGSHFGFHRRGDLRELRPDVHHQVAGEPAPSPPQPLQVRLRMHRLHGELAHPAADEGRGEHGQGYHLGQRAK